MERGRGEIRTLTGLRGLAALWVFAFHFEKFLQAPFLFSGYFGRLGVEIFFTLSGYVLCERYLAPGAGPFSFRSYLVRRFARLYPVYLAGHALAVLVYFWAYQIGRAPWQPVFSDPWHGVLNLMMLQAWGWLPELGWNSLAWSVSAEWVAYGAVFPVVVLLASQRRGGLFLGLAAGLAWGGLLWYSAVRHGGYLTFDRDGGPRVLPTFLLGALVWRWRQAFKGPAADFLAAAALIVQCWSLRGDRPVDLFLLPVFAALVLGLGGQGPVFSRLMALPGLHWLGRASYSFYLVQLPVLWVLVSLRDPQWPPLALALLALALQLPVAWACWRWIEEPGRRALTRRLGA